MRISLLTWSLPLMLAGHTPALDAADGVQAGVGREIHHFVIDVGFGGYPGFSRVDGEEATLRYYPSGNYHKPARFHAGLSYQGTLSDRFDGIVGLSYQELHGRSTIHTSARDGFAYFDSSTYHEWDANGCAAHVGLIARITPGFHLRIQPNLGVSSITDQVSSVFITNGSYVEKQKRISGTLINCGIDVACLVYVFSQCYIGLEGGYAFMKTSSSQGEGAVGAYGRGPSYGVVTGIDF